MRMKRLTVAKARCRLRRIHRDRQRDRPFEAGATSAAHSRARCQFLRWPAHAWAIGRWPRYRRAPGPCVCCRPLGGPVASRMTAMSLTARPFHSVPTGAVACDDAPTSITTPVDGAADTREGGIDLLLRLKH